MGRGRCWGVRREEEMTTMSDIIDREGESERASERERERGKGRETERQRQRQRERGQRQRDSAGIVKAEIVC